MFLCFQCLGSHTSIKYTRFSRRIFRAEHLRLFFEVIDALRLTLQDLLHLRQHPGIGWTTTTWPHLFWLENVSTCIGVSTRSPLGNMKGKENPPIIKKQPSKLSCLNQELAKNDLTNKNHWLKFIRILSLHGESSCQVFFGGLRCLRILLKLGRKCPFLWWFNEYPLTLTPPFFLKLVTLINHKHKNRHHQVDACNILMLLYPYKKKYQTLAVKSVSRCERLSVTTLLEGPHQYLSSSQFHFTYWKTSLEPAFYYIPMSFSSTHYA